MKSFRTLWSSRRHVASLAAALGLISAIACSSGELQEGLGPQSEAALDTVVTYSGTKAEANIQGLTLSPTSAALAPGQSRTFQAVGWIDGYSSPAPNTTWTATGGTVTSNGVYTAGSTPGTYQVKVVSLPTWHSETATITISGSSPAPSLAALVVTPGDLTLGKGVTQQYAATAVLSNGTTQSNPSVTWYATGGTISNTGSYRAGNYSGNYWVIATASNGRADTSRVVIPSSSTTVSSVTVTPASATVAAGATQQFAASARLTNGSTQSNPAITWSATGGTITSSGLFTAGSTAGNYRVIGRSSNGKADTSSVTVTSTTATVTAVTLTPGNVSLNTGATQTFSTQVTYSNGTTQTNPSLSWSATGGSMGGGQVYTAGSSAGNYRVVASAANGRADTAIVTIAASAPPPPSGPNAMYFNSSEAGCGTDGNVLLCDDFEDGEWYGKHCDAANASGGLLQTDGWCGTIYNAAGLSQGTGRCGGLGIRSNCVATTASMTGGTTGNMADHALASATDEVWVRFYTKPLSGYQFGAEKMLTFNDGAAGGAGIRYGNLSWNCASSTSGTGKLTMGFPMPMDVCQTQNVGNNITIESGNWYFYEVHYKLSSPGQSNGVFELWVDNCGPSGTACSGSPTLRMRRTDVNNNRTSASQLIRVLWFEAWSNPVSRGERYWDQIKVARVGPIGFMR